MTGREKAKILVGFSLLLVGMAVHFIEADIGRFVMGFGAVIFVFSAVDLLIKD